MRADQASRTAENNAAIRTLEAARPPGERICYDPYAKFFLAEHLTRANDPLAQITTMVSGWDLVFPGICNAILTRTRFIDDCLENTLEDGLEQLVILGAGYDTRALRFEGRLKGIRVFELDHPATQATKLRRCQQNMSSLPAHVTFIPIQFDREDLRQKLLANGYRGGLKTFFIWEGVTYYLPDAAVDATLAFIAGNAGAGSSVVFDYFPPSVATGTSDRMEARALGQALQQMGEGITFGLEPATIETFLNRRGFDLVQHFTMQDGRQLYFSMPDRTRHLSDIFFFVHARVTLSTLLQDPKKGI